MGRATPRRPIEPLALKLALGAMLLVVLTLVPALVLMANHVHDSSLELKRAEVRHRADIMRLAFEHEMTENDAVAITDMIDEYTRTPELERIMVLDLAGRVRETNDPAFRGSVFSQGASTCIPCHDKPPAERESSILVDLEEGQTLRTVLPLENRERCHACHDPGNSHNGILIIDTDVSSLRAQLRSNVTYMAVVVGIVAAVLLLGIVLVVRLLVLGRLDRLASAARSIAAGDLSRRVTTPGEDAIGELGEEFNTMADSLSDLLAQLRSQRLQQENVMNSVDDGLLVLDRSLRVVAANDSLARRLGVDRAELVSTGCSDVWGESCACGEGEPGDACPTRRCFDTGMLHKAIKVRRDGDGSERHEEVFASPILDEDGEVAMVVEVWRDITDRRSQEALIAEFHRLVSLGTLASGFSHEINTPLATVLVHADEMKSDLGGMEPGPEAAELAAKVDLIRSEIQRCSGITRQFLQLSRGHTLDRDLLELSSVVEDTVPLVLHVAGGRDVEVCVENGHHGVGVSANAGAVRQVLLNVLLNAIAASRPGGRVRVSVHASSRAVVRIRDEGEGMPPEVLEKVFEPFFGLNPDGTGLGLFVSHNLARHWGGEILIDSVPGRGTTVDVAFPTTGES